MFKKIQNKIEHAVKELIQDYRPMTRVRDSRQFLYKKSIYEIGYKDCRDRHPMYFYIGETDAKNEEFNWLEKLYAIPAQFDSALDGKWYTEFGLDPGMYKTSDQISQALKSKAVKHFSDLK